MMAALATQPPSLWRDRSFTLFWLARIVSIAGSSLTYVILPILIFQLSGSALQTSLLITLEAAPYLLFGLLAGALADRANRKRLMVACDLINAVLLASIPVVAWLGVLTVLHLYAVAFLSATAFVWFDAAGFGALAAVAGRERIVEANSAINSASILIELVMPAIAGVLVATIGAAPAISLDALSYLVSAIALTLVARAFQSATRSESVPGSLVRRTFDDIREGLRFIWNHKLVRALTLLGFGNSFTGGAITGLAVVYAVRFLGLGMDDARIGWLFTAGAVGALVASLSLLWLKKFVPMPRITLFSMTANVAFTVAMALVPILWIALVVRLLWSATYSLTIINGISLRQMVTPDQLQSRVNATARMIAWGGAPVGAAIGGALADVMPIQTVYLVMAIGVLLSTIIAWLSPLRKMENLTAN